METEISANPVAVRSRNQIIQALFDLMQENSYQEITIKEIAYESKLVRRTFYGHFSSKDDVIKAHLNDLFARYKKDLSAFEELDPYSVGKHFFELMLQNKATFMLLRKHNLSIPIDHLENHFQELNETFSTGQKQTDLPKELHSFVTAYFAGGLLNVLNKWIDKGMTQTPHEMALFFTHMAK
ncbi:MAG: TetR/AcrR family transcriptional regulator [Anaerolineae bacterium]|nr:TetR/AcrR family transcriptional regulator [Anaerolineae bacterium]